MPEPYVHDWKKYFAQTPQWVKVAFDQAGEQYQYIKYRFAIKFSCRDTDFDWISSIEEKLNGVTNGDGSGLSLSADEQRAYFLKNAIVIADYYRYTKYDADIPEQVKSGDRPSAFSDAKENGELVDEIYKNLNKLERLFGAIANNSARLGVLPLVENPYITLLSHLQFSDDRSKELLLNLDALHGGSNYWVLKRFCADFKRSFDHKSIDLNSVLDSDLSTDLNLRLSAQIVTGVEVALTEWCNSHMEDAGGFLPVNFDESFTYRELAAVTSWLTYKECTERGVKEALARYDENVGDVSDLADPISDYLNAVDDGNAEEWFNKNILKQQ